MNSLVRQPREVNWFRPLKFFKFYFFVNKVAEKKYENFFYELKKLYLKNNFRIIKF